MQKTILIGLDGIPYSMIQDFIKTGIMPNTGKILEKGRAYKINSNLPEISSVAWSSIITGKNPGEHGIYGFTELAPNSYTTIFPNFNNIKKAPFWLNEDFSIRHEKQFAIINVPSTYPVKHINGIHIAGFVALDLKNAVYPKDFIKPLRNIGYVIDVDAYKAHDSMDLFLRELDNVLDKRINSAKIIWSMRDWDVFMLIFTGTDRLSHFLWNAYEDKNHKYHADFLNHFRKIDLYIGELYSQLDENDTVALMSDHGFERLEYEVFINRYLYEWKLLKLLNYPANSYNDIDKGTLAFCLDPGRIYLNYKHKYPRGTVEKSDNDRIYSELSDRFRALEIKGKKVIENVFYGRDVFKGACSDAAPDLILVGAKGFDLKGSIKSADFYAKNIFNGKHTYHDTFFGIKIPSADHKDYPKINCIEDIRNAVNL